MYREEGSVDQDVPHIEAWVEEGLITEDQAEAIRRFEERDLVSDRGLISHGRIPLITEALGYLGGGLAAAALVTLLAEDWPTFPLATRLAVPFIGALVLLLAGWTLRLSDEPAFARFGSVLWALSVASAAWFMGVLAQDAFGWEDAAIGVAIGVIAAPSAAVLYAMRKTVLQLVALAAGSMILVISLVQLPLEQGESADVQTATAAWIAAVVWLFLTRKGVLRPELVAYGLGAYVAITAPDAIASGGAATVDVGLIVGLLTAFALIAASVWLRQNVLLVFGALGAFVYLLRTIEHFFGDTIGMPLVLLITGAILLAVAFLTMRLRRGPGVGPAGHHPPTAHAA